MLVVVEDQVSTKVVVENLILVSLSVVMVVMELVVAEVELVVLLLLLVHLLQWSQELAEVAVAVLQETDHKVLIKTLVLLVMMVLKT